MILGLTLIAITIASLALLRADKYGNMTSYLWGLLGYTSPADEPRQNDEQELKNESVNGVKSRQEDGTSIKAPESVAAKLEEGEATPKAKPASNRTLPPVPSFTLQSHDSDDDSEDEDNLPPPSFPALNSAQRAGGMALPRLPTLKPLPFNGAPSANGLMAPPPRPGVSRPVAAPTGAAGLRVPTTGPLPNRNPAANALATPITQAVTTPNPRKKVLLKPGHSPLDWASLKRSGQNLSGVDRLQRVTPSMLAARNGRKGASAWSVYHGKVYNITPYLPYHPGGEGELRRAAGKDGAKLFHEVHPWVNWENMLDGCLVGIMVSEGDGSRDEETSELDEMD